MGEPHFLFASNLEVPYYEAIHAGRIVLVGKKQRKRVLCVGKKGGIYVKMGTAQNPEKKEVPVRRWRMGHNCRSTVGGYLAYGGHRL